MFQNGELSTLFTRRCKHVHQNRSLGVPSRNLSTTTNMVSLCNQVDTIHRFVQLSGCVDAHALRVESSRAGLTSLIQSRFVRVVNDSFQLVEIDRFPTLTSPLGDSIHRPR